MALSTELREFGSVPESITTRATRNLDETHAGWSPAWAHIDFTAKVP